MEGCYAMMLQQAIRLSSLAALAGIAVSYLAFFTAGWPLATEAIAEWIMAETPSAWAVPILDQLGAWAKPWAMTGGLATLGFLLFGVTWMALRWCRWALVLVLPVAAMAAWIFGWYSPRGNAAFWLPATLALAWLTQAPGRFELGRRRLLTSVAMSAGTLAVAGESYWRNQRLAGQAVVPVPLFSFAFPAENFAKGLVRRAVTAVGQFYVMSKNSVDPAIDVRTWRLLIKVDGQVIRRFSYAQLLASPRRERYQTLRCISNTLKSDLMGTAQWSGVGLRQLISREELPTSVLEAAVIGVDGHGDSFPVDYAFHEEALLALGMNGKTLSRDHGYPVRLLAPRYYGFKNIKWIGEINFVSQPYFGTWPKRGFAKEAIIHTMSHIDRFRRDGLDLQLGGVAFAGSRGIERVEVRVDQGPWHPATLEPALSAYSWTRWQATLPCPAGEHQLEARAQDGAGQWQATMEKPQFPNGVAGPTIRRVGA